MTTQNTKLIVNATLDRQRSEHRLTENQLAEHLGVDPTTLWRWRSGKSLGKAAQILIPLLIPCNETPDPSPS